VARARNIKPGLFKNEILGVADPIYTLLFEGLWVLADREGRVEDRPLRIKAEIFPYRDGLSVDEMLNWLQANGFIRRYVARGKKCIVVCEFVKHQNPHKNESESELPAPEDDGAKPEEIGSTTEFIGSAPADSLSSDSLIPDSPKETAPRKRAATPSQPDIAKPDDVEPQTWADFLKLRKAKRAPVTQTVVDEAKRECAKAGMTLEGFLRVWCRRGSQGLEAAWLKPDERAQGQAAVETPYQRSMRERMQEAAPEIARRAPAAPPQDAADFFRTVDAQSRVVDVKAIEVTT